MKTDPFPEVRTSVDLKATPESRGVECVLCVEHKFLDNGTDPTLWAEMHVEQRPGHTRFRTVTQSNFRVSPSGLVVEP